MGGQKAIDARSWQRADLKRSLATAMDVFDSIERRTMLRPNVISLSFIAVLAAAVAAGFTGDWLLAIISGMVSAAWCLLVRYAAAWFWKTQSSAVQLPAPGTAPGPKFRIPECPWQLPAVRALLRGTHDEQSSLWHLQRQSHILELIVWRLPELFLTRLLADLLKDNPGVTEKQLRKGLILGDEDGSIRRWDLCNCNLRVLPESFGGVRVSGGLWLDYNQLRVLPESFGSITVGGALYLKDNALISLPDSFGSTTVGGDLYLTGNQLQDEDLPDMWPAHFLNVSGKVFT